MARVDPSPTEQQLRRRRRPSEVRQLVLESAIEVFAQRGYGGTSTKEIAEVAGVSESVLFRHFSSKSNLFVEAAVRPFKEFLAEFTEDSVVGRGHQLDERTLITSFVRHVYDNMEARRGMILALATANHPELEGVRDEIADQFEAAIFHPLQELSVARAKERGIKPRNFELTTRAIVAMVTAMAVLDPWFVPQGWKRPSRDAIIEELVAITLYGAAIDRDARYRSFVQAPARNGGNAPRARSKAARSVPGKA